MSNEEKKINIHDVDSTADFKGKLKHTARCILWLPAAKDLKKDKKRFLKYFTLPGKLALDIFLFEKEDIIKRNGRKGFPDVRFCDNRAQSYAEAKKRLGSTIGIKKNFEDLVLNGHKIFWDGFPYDLYNLDFCGTCFPDNQPPFSNTFKAIQKIIDEHSEKGEFPFVILLTLKVFKKETHPLAINDLKENIESNRINACFSEKINEVIPDTNRLIEENFDNFIITSIPKMICRLAKGRCNVDIKARAKYKRHNPKKGDFYIANFVFEFRLKSPSLKVENENYNKNILKVVNLNNIKEISNSDLNEEIKRSHKELIDNINSNKASST